MATIEIKVPDIGDYDSVPVIEILVAVGDTVKKDQGLVTLESDKATLEVPSTAAGVVKEIKVKLDDKLSEGDVVVVLEAEGAAAAPAAVAAASAPAPAAAPVQQAVAPAPAAVSAPAATGPVEVKVPDIGDYDGVPVIEILVAVGDTVKKDQGLVTLESDKATLEVPSTADGVVKEIKVKLDDKLSEGDVVVVLEAAAAAPAAAKAAPGSKPPVTPSHRAPDPAVAARALPSSGRRADIECRMVVLGAGP